MNPASIPAYCLRPAIVQRKRLNIPDRNALHRPEHQGALQMQCGQSHMRVRR